MSETVSTVAQLCMDAFYQDFKPSDGFFRLEHFKRYAIAADAKLKMDEFKEQVALNLRQGKRNATVVLSAENYETVSVDVKDEKAQLPTSVMSFPGAVGENLGVLNVSVNGCGNLMRTNQRQKWQACRDAETVYWYEVKCGLEFMHLKSNCNADKAIVTYVPELDGGSIIAESRKWAIINMVTIFLKSAKEGVVVDKSNDSNTNSFIQSEINKHVLRELQSR